MSTASAINGELGKSGGRQVGANLPQLGETNFRVINAIKEMYAEAAAKGK